MYKITIKGKAYSEFHNLAKLDGIVCQDEFCEYMDSNDCSGLWGDSSFYFIYIESIRANFSVNNHRNKAALKNNIKDSGKSDCGDDNFRIGR